MHNNNSLAPGCNPPLLSEGNYSPNGGDIAGRYCVTLTEGLATLSCCLPCPSTDWIYSDSFPRQTRIANYISIVSLVLNSFLLLTFAIIPQEKSHRHYLSIGLTVSMMSIAVAFIVPLGTKPDLCYNDITPNDLHTNLSCAFTGVLVEAGAMGAVVWILLRSIWTALRIMADFKRPELFKNISIGLGVGLPILFLAISLPVTGVSYSLGNVCIPANPSALPTWFAWIIIFATVSWIIQVVTIVFCLWRFASFSLAGPSHGTGTSQSSIPSVSSGGTPQTLEQKIPLTPSRRKRVAWRKVRSVLTLQWRSIVMAFIVANVTIQFGIVFIQHTVANKAQFHTKNITDTDFEWIACLMANHGEKDKCLHGGSGLGVSESRVVGTLILASFIGIIVFLLQVRSSMFIGWWSLMRNPRSFFRRPSVDTQVLFGNGRRQPKAENTDDAVDMQATSVPSAA